MSFNIFDYPKNSDVRVGYVDPNLGYVTGVSICDANEYAKKNPGTTFIFETRDGIRYLNINEVNKLTPEDLATSVDTCKGVEVEGNPDPPSTIFYGGAGVGASGNPVFGKDGSLLAVDLISSGFGYQYPPKVEVKDETGLGVGAVTRAVLVGDPEYSDCKYVETEEVFDQESDFEDYQLCDTDITGPEYGFRYDSNGKPIGKWDPTLYATLTKDPISRQIKEYQDFLRQLDTPWWTTRKQSPLRVISPSRPENRTKHDVQHPGWGGDYKSTTTITTSTTNGSQTQSKATGFRDVTFNVFTSVDPKDLGLLFKSEDGSHSFRIKVKDFKQNQTGQKVNISLKVNTVYNVIAEGTYRKKGAELGIIGKVGRKPLEVNTTDPNKVLTGQVIFADFIRTANDNDDLQVEATLGKFSAKLLNENFKETDKGINTAADNRSTYSITYELQDSSAYVSNSGSSTKNLTTKTSDLIEDSFMNRYAVSPVPPSNAPGSDFAGQEFTMEWEEEFPYEGEYIFRAQADNLGRFYLDNEKLIETTQFKKDKTPKFVKKNVTAGPHRIRIDLYNQPQYEKKVSSFTQGVTTQTNQQITNQATTQITTQSTDKKIICHAGGGFGGLKDTTKQDKVGKVVIGKGSDGAPGLAPGLNKPASTQASGGGSGLKNGSSVASGATLDGEESPIASSTDGFISGPYYGLPYGNWWIRDGSVKGNIFTGGGFTLFNGAYYADAKNGYGYGGTMHYRGRTDGQGFTPRFITPDMSSGGNGAVRIKYSGKTQDYTKPGTYNFTIPEGVTTIDVICIGGGGSGFVRKEDSNGNYSVNTLNDSGGSGGAYAYDTITVSPGAKLKIVVGSGGLFVKGGSSNGADSYVEVEQTTTTTTTVTVPTPAQSTSQSSTQSELQTQVKKVFNTVDYIDKADRKLWRLDPRAGKDSAFINQYGILPFDLNSSQAQTESLSGTHVIRWEYVDFPVDGNYNIEVMVDDNVTLYIGNRDGGGRVAIGNGLKDIEQGGDEVIIRKNGFSSPGKSTGKSLETKFFKAGKYRIRAELEQISGSALNKGNPMALAINIETSFVEEEVISKRSWNENPMGAALTIDAPLPPIPQEPIPPQEGRCPNNPIWTTRFPTAKQKWWPVNYVGKNINDPSWSKFMNRYAISPIPPLSKKGSDGGGIVYRNEWEIDIPYDGFYAFKSTVDNAGRILVDNQPIMQANYIPTNLRNTKGGSGVEQRSGIEAIDGGLIYNWRENNPKAKKVFLTKGRHVIQIEVENGITNTFTKIDKKVFSTKDWLFPPKVIQKTSQQTVQKITQQTTQQKVSGKIVCHAGGGFGGLKNTSRQENVGRVIIGRGSNGSPGFAPGNSDKTSASGGGAGLRSGRSLSSGTTLTGAESSITNTILPSGPFTGEPIRAWVAFGDKRGAVFTGVNRYIPFNGNAFYDVKTGYGYGGTIHLKGDRGFRGDLFVYPERSAGGSGAVRISFNGKTQDYTKPGTYEFVVPEGVTALDLTCIGGGGSGYSESTPNVGGGVQYLLDTLKDTGGSGGAYAYDTVTVTPGTRLKVVVGAGGVYVDKGSKNGEDSYVEVKESTIDVTSSVTTDVTVDVTSSPVSTEIISQSPSATGVVYEGPTPIANYKGDFISPALQNVNAKPNGEIQGKTWLFRWSNVDFPVDGQYTLESEADDNLIVRVNGIEVGQSKVFGGRGKTTFNATRGKKTIELELSNISIPNTGFDQNPVVGFAQITVPIDTETGVSKPWTENPVGISAILIPPPCPKKVIGKGVVCRVIVDDPGNGYPTIPGAGYPATLRLRSVEVESPGINYNCGVDQIQITPSNGAQLTYECDTFGRISKVKVLNPGLGFNVTPEITIPSTTGVNARFRPQFEVVRDPIVVDPQVIIQVTDLVGLKQTGYVDGRPYYGAVFYKDGVRYAGFYQTPGRLVQVYTTLQESIDAQVVTPPSAIQRQGTDISSNDPRLNIPGTPGEII